MPISFDVDRVRNLTLFTVRGDITADMLRDAVKRFWESSALSLNLLWDIRDAFFVHIKYSEMNEIPFKVDAYGDRFKERKIGKTAVVVNSDEQYSLMKQLSSQASMQ
jgi:hypothetical protein